MTNMYRRLVWLVLAILLCIAAGLAINYLHSFKKVAVTLNFNSQVSIYKDLGGDGAYNYNTQGRPLFTLSSSQTIKLKRGVYDFVVADPGHQYMNPVTKFIVSDKTTGVTINPSFTNQKLAALLSIQRPAIQRALLAQYPSLPNFYTVTPDKLYGRGDWYGAALSPLSPRYDKLRIIMEHRDGNWVVAAKPQINISIPSSPSIPSSVIDDVDQL